MTINLLNGDEKCCGAVTTGGTESTLMAVKAYRDRAARYGIKTPQIVAPVTAHASLDKAGLYFKVKIVRIPVNPKTMKVAQNDIENAITKNTIALWASAPSVPHGVVDDIPAFSDIAQRHRIGLHIDAGLGGFFLPFLSFKKRADVPVFDFRNPGVTSMSADTSKVCTLFVDSYFPNLTLVWRSSSRHECIAIQQRKLT